MQVTVHNAIIDISMVLKPSRQLWQWEVPVVKEKFGEGNVRLLDAVEIEREGLPDAADEYVRLAQMYGSDSGQGGTNASFVEMAYGRGKAGVAALREAIEASEVGAQPKPKAKKKVSRKKAEPEVTDPVEANEVDEGDPLAA